MYTYFPRLYRILLAQIHRLFATNFRRVRVQTIFKCTYTYIEGLKSLRFCIQLCLRHPSVLRRRWLGNSKDIQSNL